MPGTTNSAKLTDTERVDGSILSDAPHPDKATAVLIDFMKTIFKEGAHNWSPEELEKRINACLAEAAAYRKAEDSRDLKNFSRGLRQQIELNEFRPDGEAGIVYDFMKELRGKDLTTCSPEELEKIKRPYADKLLAFQKEKDGEFLDTLFSSLHKDQLSESPGSPVSSPKGSPHSRIVPFRPQKEVQKAIKELADSIKFD